jgi:hypothetical protein
MKMNRWLFAITLFLVLCATAAIGDVAPVCPKCGRLPPCPTNPPPDYICDPQSLAQMPLPEPTPTPTPTPTK